MTFLEICQAIARESGVIAGGQLTTTVYQNNKLLKVVSWGREAYNEIQRARSDWRWMIGSFSAATVASQRAYTGANMGVSTRFSRFLVNSRGPRGSRVWCYPTADGRATEWEMHGVTWEDFMEQLDLGSRATETGRPTHIAVDDAGRLQLYPTPDATGYTLRGRYRKAVQNLEADTDEPEMPEDHHMAIVWLALINMANHDEAFDMIPGWDRQYQMHMQELMQNHLPDVTMSGPMA